ncbi:hypothetical protein ASPZODRAFT_105400 [Penicilliopsis zonata CBS 506.65]|uniref:Nephrocystin 3-like N-terminal domain-containing protein n=1 Tax=Penicilliopsis zonata CBS 506.65 TaxID=1073090 RepID=A0A1L9S5A8_9EURO|nr:hypothetical protein ASPZODRAFT_105400 [Penicilliopsis zonata CBS 506.65]OJJ42341.1 hypothetical protein ASPZODRAFT_105400 [Penicilliopsis zonata CBS 506.65]
MAHGRLKNLFHRSDKRQSKQNPSTQNQLLPPSSSSAQNTPTQPAKPDLWQRAFDGLDSRQQELLKSIPIPKSQGTANPSVEDRLKALNGVVDDVQKQYEIDREKSRIRESAQKVIKAILTFSDVVEGVAAFDPTGHATGVWAIVSLGLTITQNYHCQKMAWLNSSATLADVLAEYSLVEGEYHRDPKTDKHVETALVRVYSAVLTFAAEVWSRQKHGKVTLIWQSVTDGPLSEMQKSIEKEQAHFDRWLRICHRREQRQREEQILKQADEMLTGIDRVMVSINELGGNILFSQLKIAEEASYNADTGEEYQECLKDTRTELLKDIKSWVADPNKEAVFWLQGMAGTGKSTVSRTVARWLDNEGLLGGSFFFKKGGTDREDARRLFTTITKQMMDRLPQLREPVKKVIEETSSIGSVNPREQFNKLLFQPLQSLKLGLNSPLLLVVVVDALDECQVAAHVEAFLSTLPELKNLSDIRLRFFITSRPEPPVIRGFRPVENNEVILHQIAKPIIEHDIAIFLRQRLDAIRQQHLILDDNWPGEGNFQALVEMAVPLFIYAATIYRFINADGELPDERLQTVLSSRSKHGTKNIDSEYARLADIYAPILKHTISQKKTNELKSWMDDFRRIVGTIILLYSPLSSSSLAELIDLKKEKVWIRLSSLQSVLSVPKQNEETVPVRLLHLSFREFLVDREASDAFWIDEQMHHTRLAERCLQCMNRELKRDICRLSRPGVKLNEIEHTTIEGHISPELRYACRYWIRHLENSGPSDINWELIDTFLKAHFLHWLEAMSLLGWCSETTGNILSIESLAKDHGNSELSAFLYDARRFILRHRGILEDAPLQLYYSVLLFTPKSSIVRTVFRKQIPTFVHFDPADDDWGPVLQTLEGYSRRVSSIALSPDEKILASASVDGTIFFRDFHTGRLLNVMDDHQEWIRSIEFSHDGQFLASGSEDHTVKVWETKTGQLLKTLNGHSQAVQCVAFAPKQDSLLLASGSEDGTIRVWDLSTPQDEPIIVLQGQDEGVRVHSVCFMKGDRQLASATDTGIAVWDLQSHRKREFFTGDWAFVHSLAYSPNGHLLASISLNDSPIRIWNPDTGTLLATLEHSELPNSISFSPDGSQLASGSSNCKILIWDMESRTVARVLHGHASGICDLTFSKDAGLLVSGSYDRTVKVWDLNHKSSGSKRRDGMSILTCSSNNEILATHSGSSDTITLWNAKSGALLKETTGHHTDVQMVVFSPDEKQLISCGNDIVQILDIDSGTVPATLKAKDVRVVSVSSNGRWLAAGAQSCTMLWSMDSSGLSSNTAAPQILNCAGYWTRCLAFSHDGNLLASATKESITIWKLSLGSATRLHDLAGFSSSPRDLTFKPNGDQLVVLTDEMICLWDTHTGTQTHHIKVDESLRYLDYAEDGTSLETEKGILHIQSAPMDLAQPAPEATFQTSNRIILEEPWIYFNDEAILQLPQEFFLFRPMFILHKGTFIIANHNGNFLSLPSTNINI